MVMATKEYNQILPQLNNCDVIANHWARELMTIFEHTCVKEWRENQHLKVAGLLVNKIEKCSLIISSSDIILNEDDDFRNIRPDTLIFISTPTADEATITKWSERQYPELYITLRKNKNNFSIISGGTERVKDYLKFKSIKELNIKLRRFISNSLAAQGLQRTRSKGAKISNQNSDVQSTRKKGKLVKGSKVHLFGNNIIDLKTMKDAHDFVASEYGYEKSYRTFVRELKKESGAGKANVIEFKKNNDSLQVSLMDI
jgi:hypothetical protein